MQREDGGSWERTAEIPLISYIVSEKNENAYVVKQLLKMVRLTYLMLNDCQMSVVQGIDCNTNQ